MGVRRSSAGDIMLMACDTEEVPTFDAGRVLAIGHEDGPPSRTKPKQRDLLL